MTEKFERDGKAYARVKVECLNHREELTAAGTAEVERPKR